MKSRKISPLAFVLIAVAIAGGAAFAFAASITNTTNPNATLNVGQIGVQTTGYKIGNVAWNYDTASPTDAQVLQNVSFTMTNMINNPVTSNDTIVELALTSSGTAANTCVIGTEPVAGTVTCHQTSGTLLMNQVSTFNLIAHQNSTYIAP